MGDTFRITAAAALALAAHAAALTAAGHLGDAAPPDRAIRAEPLPPVVTTGTPLHWTLTIDAPDAVPVTITDDTGDTLLTTTLTPGTHTLSITPTWTGPGQLTATLDPTHTLPDADRRNHVATATAYATPPGQPDLVADTLDLPAALPAGGTLHATLSAHNAGPAHATQRVTTTLYLDASPTLSPDAIPLETHHQTPPLTDGQAWSHTFTAPLPPDADGVWYVHAVLDAPDTIDEHNETNNTLVQPIAIDPVHTPDLVPTQLLTPPTLTRGRAFTTDTAVLNAGNVPTSPAPDHKTRPWTDVLLLSHDDQPSKDDVPVHRITIDTPLPAGAVRTLRTADPTIPEDWPPGDAFLLLVTDASDAIDETNYESNNTLAVPITVQTQAEADDATQALGDPDGPDAVTVAWISHDAFQQLVTDNVWELDQPSVQTSADPVPDAPMRVAVEDPGTAQPTPPSTVRGDTDADPGSDPPPPVPAPAPRGLDAVIAAARRALPGLDTPPTTLVGPPAQRDDATPTPSDTDTPDTPRDTTGDTEPADASDPSDAPDPVDEPSEAPSPDDTDTPDDANGTPDPTPPGRDAPTSSDRGDLESPPVVRLRETLPAQPGSVITGQGLRIRTATPRISLTTRMTSTVERNPVVQITFDRDGNVVDAELVESSGRPEYDGPIRNSLWRYAAEGDDLAELEGHLEVRIRLILRRDLEPAND